MDWVSQFLMKASGPKSKWVANMFSEHDALGVQASVYDVNAKRWIASSEPLENIEHRKFRMCTV